jgi:hypothetical protein
MDNNFKKHGNVFRRGPEGQPDPTHKSSTDRQTHRDERIRDLEMPETGETP